MNELSKCRIKLKMLRPCPSRPCCCWSKPDACVQRCQAQFEEKAPRPACSLLIETVPIPKHCRPERSCFHCHLGLWDAIYILPHEWRSVSEYQFQGQMFWQFLSESRPFPRIKAFPNLIRSAQLLIITISTVQIAQCTVLACILHNVHLNSTTVKIAQETVTMLECKLHDVHLNSTTVQIA